MIGADLVELCEKILAKVGSTAVEVQAMHVDGQVAVTANNAPALRVLFGLNAKNVASLVGALPGFSAAVARRLVDPKAPAGDRLGTMKHADRVSDCADKMIIKDRSLILMHGEDLPDLHAEQRLLVVLALMLKAGVAVDTIHIWGAKPPCASCGAALRSFSHALDIVYDKCIIFSGVPGQDRDRVTRLSLSTLFPAEIGNFARFVIAYESKMTELRG